MNPSIEKTAADVAIRGMVWNAAEIRVLLEIENRCFNRFDAYHREDFERWFHYNPDLCLVAEVGGRTVGYAMTRVLPDRGDMASLAVNPDFRRRDVGARLFQATVEGVLAYGKNLITIEVRKTNLAGLSFWKKMGFLQYGIEPGFYEDGETAVLMQQEIAQPLTLFP